jgi:hypothetical protein
MLVRYSRAVPTTHQRPPFAARIVIIMSSNSTPGTGARSRFALTGAAVRRRWCWLAGVLAVGSLAAVLAWNSTDHFTVAEKALLAQVKANPDSAAYISENQVPDSYLVHLGHFGCDSAEDLATLTARLSEDLAAHDMGDAQGFSVGMVVVSDGAKVLCPPR